MPAFPTFEQGNSVFTPLRVARTFRNLIVENDSGFPFAYNQRSTPLMSWRMEGVTMSDNDVETLRAHWAASDGAWSTWEFTDEDTATTYSKCRYDGNELQIEHFGWNENRVTIGWKEVV